MRARHPRGAAVRQRPDDHGTVHAAGYAILRLDAARRRWRTPTTKGPGPLERAVNTLDRRVQRDGGTVPGRAWPSGAPSCWVQQPASEGAAFPRAGDRLRHVPGVTALPIPIWSDCIADMLHEAPTR